MVGKIQWSHTLHMKPCLDCIGVVFLSLFLFTPLFSFLSCPSPSLTNFTPLFTTHLLSTSLYLTHQQITGIPPDGLTPEEIERMRKKFGVSFKFSKFVLDKAVQVSFRVNQNASTLVCRNGMNVSLESHHGEHTV